MKFVIFGILLATVYSMPSKFANFQDYIETVNKAKTTWKAGRNYGSHITSDYIKGLCGFLKNPKNSQLPSKNLIF